MNSNGIDIEKEIKICESELAWWEGQQERLRNFCSNAIEISNCEIENQRKKIALNILQIMYDSEGDFDFIKSRIKEEYGVEYTPRDGE